MKKSDKLRKQTRKLIVKNLIIVITLAVVAFVGAFSWFKDDPDADAKGISVTAQVQDGLEFYIMPPSSADQYSAINSRLENNAALNSSDPSPTPRRTTWHKQSDTLTFDYTDQELKFMEGLFLCEVTSDGKTFQVPKLLQFDEIAYVDETQNFDTATANDEYMSFDIYFRSESSHNILLLYDSKIEPKTTLTAGTYSAPGDTKKDAAIGAVRLSIQNMEVSGGPRELLWIPGASVYYNGAPSTSGISGADTLTIGLSSSQFANKGAAYYNGTSIALRSGEGTNTHAYYASKTTRNVISATDAGLEGRLVASDSTWKLGSSSSDNITVLTLSNHDSTNGYYYGHIRVNLWIEGEDAEARLGYVGGKFDMFLHFDIED